MLLRGTHAAVRCRIRIERAAWAEARVELLTLQTALEELGELALEPAAARQREALMATEAKLRPLVPSFEDRRA